MIIDLGESRNKFRALTLFHASAQSKEVPFKLYSLNKKTNTWVCVQQFTPKSIKDVMSGYNKTGDFETFITDYKIVEEINAQKLKLVFNATNQNIIAMRELDFTFDRSKEFNFIISKIKKWALKN